MCTVIEQELYWVLFVNLDEEKDWMLTTQS